MGAECCPYKVFFLAAILLPPLVGIGKGEYLAGYYDTCLLSHRQSPQGVAIFIFPWV